MSLEDDYRRILQAEEDAARPDPGTNRSAISRRKGVVTDGGAHGDEVEVDDAPARNLTGTTLTSGDRVWMDLWDGKRVAVLAYRHGPQGQIAYEQHTSDITGITSEQTVLDTTVDLPAGRRIQVTGQATARPGSGSRMLGRIYLASADMGRWCDFGGSGIDGITRAIQTGAVRLSLPASTVTFAMTVERVSGSADCQLDGSTSARIWLAVDDLGPA